MHSEQLRTFALYQSLLGPAPLARIHPIADNPALTAIQKLLQASASLALMAVATSMQAKGMLATEMTNLPPASNF